MSTMALATCAERGCSLPVANDGAWAAGEERTRCARHRQLARNRAGLCPNCATPIEELPIINSITGLPRTSAGVPCTQPTCPACGYEPRRKRGR